MLLFCFCFLVAGVGNGNILAFTEALNDNISLRVIQDALFFGWVLFSCGSLVVFFSPGYILFIICCVVGWKCVCVGAWGVCVVGWGVGGGGPKRGLLA